MPKPFDLPRTTTKEPRLQGPASMADYRARRNFVPTGDPYKPTPAPNVGDVARSATTGVANTVEGTPAIPGDAADMRWSLVRLINDYFKDKSGMDMSADIDRAEHYGRSNLPTTEDVQAFTDRGISQLSPEMQARINGLIRHQSTTPFGSAAGFGAELAIDPLDLGAARLARRMF